MLRRGAAADRQAFGDGRSGLDHFALGYNELDLHADDYEDDRSGEESEFHVGWQLRGRRQ